MWVINWKNYICLIRSTKLLVLSALKPFPIKECLFSRHGTFPLVASLLILTHLVLAVSRLVWSYRFYWHLLSLKEELQVRLDPHHTSGVQQSFKFFMISSHGLWHYAWHGVFCFLCFSEVKVFLISPGNFFWLNLICYTHCWWEYAWMV